MKNYYDLLNVTKDSSLQDIKKNYYKLAKQLHPDKTNNNSIKNLEFINIQEAYDVLSDENKRKTYDMSIDDEKIFEDFANIFNNFNFDDNGTKDKKPEHDLFISIEEYIYGNCKKKVTVKKNIPCTVCNETGIHDHYVNTCLCTFCGGTGLDINLPIFNCSKCHGKCFEILNNIKCQICEGYTYLTNNVTICLNIPKLSSKNSLIFQDDIQFNIKYDFDNEIDKDGYLIITQNINPIQWLVGHKFQIKIYDKKIIDISTTGAFDISIPIKIHNNVMLKFLLVMNSKQIKNLKKAKPIFEKLYKKNL